MVIYKGSRKKIWAEKFSSFKESEAFESLYSSRRTPEERLSDMQFCREMHFKMRGIDVNAYRKRLRRTFRVIQ